MYSGVMSLTILLKEQGIGSIFEGSAIPIRAPHTTLRKMYPSKHWLLRVLQIIEWSQAFHLITKVCYISKITNSLRGVVNDITIIQMGAHIEFQ